MPQNSFSVSTNCYGWGDFTIAECLEPIAKTPIRSLELPAAITRPNSLIPEIMLDESFGGSNGWRYSVADLKALLDDKGFAAESVDVFGRWLGAKGVQLIKSRIDLAADIGAEFIVLGMAHEVDDETRAAQYTIVREVADHAAPKGVRVALEVHGGIMGSAAEMVRTMEEVGRDNVGINFDTANIVHYNPDADGAKELEAVAKHVIHVHLKDIIHDEAGGRLVHTRLGEGTVDFRRVFDILHGADFYGPFAFELETFHGTARDRCIDDYHEDLVAAMEYVRSLGEFTT